MLTPDEKQGLQQKLGRNRLPEGALAQVKNVDLRRFRKGRRRQVDGDREPRLRARDRGIRGGGDGRGRVGIQHPPHARRSGRPRVSEERKILPIEAAGGVKVMSIGFFVEDDAAVVWRGPMLHKAIQQFLEDVDWGALDYLLIDLPPGTGDVSMTLAQLLPQAKMLLVTTPQPAAQTVAHRAAEMAGKFDLEVIGVVENMSGFTTPDGSRYTIFGEGGGQQLADDIDAPLLGKIPLQEELRVHADQGRPLVADDPDAPASQAIFHLARGLVAATPRELPVIQAPAMAAAPGFGGKELPVIQ